MWWLFGCCVWHTFAYVLLISSCSFWFLCHRAVCSVAIVWLWCFVMRFRVCARNICDNVNDICVAIGFQMFEMCWRRIILNSDLCELHGFLFWEFFLSACCDSTCCLVWMLLLLFTCMYWFRIDCEWRSSSVLISDLSFCNIICCNGPPFVWHCWLHCAVAMLYCLCSSVFWEVAVVGAGDQALQSFSLSSLRCAQCCCWSTHTHAATASDYVCDASVFDVVGWMRQNGVQFAPLGIQQPTQQSAVVVVSVGVRQPPSAVAVVASASAFASSERTDLQIQNLTNQIHNSQSQIDDLRAQLATMRHRLRQHNIRNRAWISNTKTNVCTNPRHATQRNMKHMPLGIDFPRKRTNCANKQWTTLKLKQSHKMQNMTRK